MSKKKASEAFEDKLTRLEEIAASLESGDLGLEDSIQLFDEGVKLSKECLSILENAELKITKLKTDLDKMSKSEDDTIIE
jgi:exodeoxyribonuclease VII small subunit